jgi:hypothetical protein
LEGNFRVVFSELGRQRESRNIEILQKFSILPGILNNKLFFFKRGWEDGKDFFLSEKIIIMHYL